MSDLDLLIDRAKSYGGVRVYAIGKVPPKPIHPYRVMSLGSPEDQGRMNDGSTWTDRRFVVQHFGRTHDDVTAVAEDSDRAFKDQHLPEFEGEPFCWRELSTPPYRDPDDSGVLNVTHTYRL